MSGERKPQSENPFEYEDEWTDDVGAKCKVLAVKDDMVCVEYTPGKTFEWYIFRNLLDRGWRKVPTRKWEDLTAENWRERRDQPVWVKEVLNGAARVENLIWFNPNKPHFLTVDRSGFADTWNHASIYNDDGEEARWEER